MFKITGQKKERNMLSYFKIFLSFAVIVLVTNIALSSTMYVNYERHAVDLVQTYTVEELHQISYSTDFMFEAAKLTLLQLYANPAVLKLMNYDDLDELEAASLLRQVSVVNINLPLVNSVYIYNKQAARMYYDGKAFPLTEFPDQDIVDRLEQPGEVLSLRPLARQIPSTANYFNLEQDPEQLDDVYTFVFFDGRSNQIDNAIVLNVSQGWMKSTIDSMNPGNSGEMLIADSEGWIKLGNERFNYLDNMNRYADFHDILSRDQPSGYVVKMIDGIEYLVSYVSPSVQDWKYIRFTPYEAVSGKLKRMLAVTLIIFILITVGSVLAVMFITKVVYGLFNRKLREIERRYSAEKNNGYEKKQRFLKMLATQKVEEGELRKRLSQYEIPFRLEHSFMTVVVKIDRYEAHCQRYGSEDRSLLAYGFMNIAGELGAPLFRQEAVDLGDGYLAVILNVEEEGDETLTVKLESWVSQLQSKTSEYLGISSSVAIGDRLDEIGDLSQSTAQCIEALDYKLFHGPGAVIYVSAVREMKKREYFFSEEQITELLEHLLAGNQEGVNTCSRSILDSTRGYAITALQTAVLQLAISLKESLKTYNIFADELRYDQFINVASRITSFETIDEIAVRLQELLESISAVWLQAQESVKRNERYSDMLDKVAQFLEQEYANPNLSPELLAEHMGISAKYLRTLYKKAAGEPLGETINRYRMDRAKQLLEGSEASVQEVALQSGFANINYFYTLFKKYNGLTPNEFRQLKHVAHQI